MDITVAWVNVCL